MAVLCRRDGRTPVDVCQISYLGFFRGYTTTQTPSHEKLASVDGCGGLKEMLDTDAKNAGVIGDQVAARSSTAS